MCRPFGYCRYGSTLIHRPKMELRAIQPLIRPRLLPIWNRSPCVAFTKCRYSRPFTLQSTISPTSIGSSAEMGTTVQSCPDSILPTIELPRGRKLTVSPAINLAMYCVAHPINEIHSLSKNVCISSNGLRSNQSLRIESYILCPS